MRHCWKLSLHIYVLIIQFSMADKTDKNEVHPVLHLSLVLSGSRIVKDLVRSYSTAWLANTKNYMCLRWFCYHLHHFSFYFWSTQTSVNSMYICTISVFTFGLLRPVLTVCTTWCECSSHYYDTHKFSLYTEVVLHRAQLRRLVTSKLSSIT